MEARRKTAFNKRTKFDAECSMIYVKIGEAMQSKARPARIHSLLKRAENARVECIEANSDHVQMTSKTSDPDAAAKELKKCSL